MSGTSKVSPELKAQILEELKEVGVMATVANKHGISSKTIYNWVSATKNKVQIDQSKETRALQKKLKDAELEILVLKELLKKTYPHWQSAEKL